VSLDESTNKELSDSKINSAPISMSSLSVVDISLKCGVLVKVIGSSAKIEANKIGRDEFLEPAALIVPFKAFPP
jgi:hypothetical protein